MKNEATKRIKEIAAQFGGKIPALVGEKVDSDHNGNKCPSNQQMTFATWIRAGRVGIGGNTTSFRMSESNHPLTMDAHNMAYSVWTKEPPGTNWVKDISVYFESVEPQ